MICQKIIHPHEYIAAADAIMKAFVPKTASDAQDALKTILGPIFEALLKGELDLYV